MGQQMERSNTTATTMSYQMSQISKWNRIYSYFALLTCVLQILLLSFLVFGYYAIYEQCSSDFVIESDANSNECIGQLEECNDASNDCTVHRDLLCDCVPEDMMSLSLIVYILL